MSMMTGMILTNQSCLSSSLQEAIPLISNCLCNKLCHYNKHRHSRESGNPAAA